MLTNLRRKHFEYSLELWVIGEVLLGVLMPANVIVFFLDLELSNFSFVALLFVEPAFEGVQKNRKNFVVDVSDINETLSDNEGVFPCHGVLFSQTVFIFLDQVFEGGGEEKPVDRKISGGCIISLGDFICPC